MEEMVFLQETISLIHVMKQPVSDNKLFAGKT